MKRYVQTMVYFCMALLLMVPTAFGEDNDKTVVKKQDPKARALLDAAKEKLRSLDSLIVDMGSGSPTTYFERSSKVFLERPNRFRVDHIRWSVVEESDLGVVSDGNTVTRFNNRNFIAYQKPVRRENFFLGQNFLIQFFFDSQAIRFDPASSTWGRPISLFDSNAAAYDKDVDLKYLGERTMQGKRYDVVEIKYNTVNNDIRQQIYIADDKLVYQVDSYSNGRVGSQKFRNFRINPSLPADTWDASKNIPKKIPILDTDPVRMGAKAPDFTLPGHNGGEYTLRELLDGSKGMLICTLQGAMGKYVRNADALLPQMRMMQELKDKFEPQGLQVFAIVGGPEITPEVKEEMMLNWMPDVSRFNYPILIDIDLERGIQGSAFENFHLNGRGTLLLDSEGKVVFASRGGDGVDKLALYQALAQIGFAVSPADLE